MPVAAYGRLLLRALDRGPFPSGVENTTLQGPGLRALHRFTPLDVSPWGPLALSLAGVDGPWWVQKQRRMGRFPGSAVRKLWEGDGASGCIRRSTWKSYDGLPEQQGQIPFLLLRRNFPSCS